MLKYSKNSFENIAPNEDDNIPEWHKETKKSISSDNAGKWKAELTNDEIAEAGKRLSKYFDYFGYKKLF